MNKFKDGLQRLRRWLKLNINWLLAKRKIASYKARPFINIKSKFNGKTHLGIDVHFNGITITGQGNVYIGDHFHSGQGCLIISDAHDYKNATKLPYDEKLLTPDTIIEENVWLGSRVIILAGVTIGYGAIIQAGSVVVKDVEPLSIVGGHPAKIFSRRSEAHYCALKTS